jgi:predicted metal-dependent hydrolase
MKSQASSVEYNGRTIVFDIEYRNRRTMAIHIRPPGDVMVFSPLHTDEEMIRERVRSKGRWILKKIAEIKHLDPKKFKKKFVQGEKFLFLGKHYNLKIIKNGRKIPKVFFEDGVFYLEAEILDYERSKKAMEKWYRGKADRIISDRVEHYSQKLGNFPRSAKAKEQKRRWGSCTSRGDLYFNWRLVMAPPGIVDYIVVHELCHLIHGDHSRKYWDLVGSILPDFKKRKKWLKENGLKLEI